MAVTISTNELKETLELTPSTQNIMLVGKHGIGKSEILTSYFQSQGMKVVALFLGQMSDPGDIIGLPSKVEAKDANGNVTAQTDFTPPYWFPIDGKPIVLFLDELNRARPEILQTVMDLTLNRKLAGKVLPEGSRVIAAVNDGDEYQLTDLDPALVSRFNVVTFRPTAQEWLLWAEKVGVDARVRDFIRENPMWLDKNPDAKEGADTGLDKTPDRRGWKRVSDILKTAGDISPIVTKAIAAIVGPKAASALAGSVSARKILSGREVLQNFEKHLPTLKGYELHQLSVVNDGIFRHLEENAKRNIDAYFTFLSKEKKEAAAHFANLYVQGTYPKAVSFMARECQVLTMAMVMYVKSIR